VSGSVSVRVQCHMSHMHSKVCHLSYRLWSLAGRHVERSVMVLFSSRSLNTIFSDGFYRTTDIWGSLNSNICTAVATTLTKEAHDDKSFNCLVLSNETQFNTILIKFTNYFPTSQKTLCISINQLLMILRGTTAVSYEIHMKC
jgi:hypothetical protein